VTKSPDPTDKYVGSRVRMRRLMLGMSQSALGHALGVTFQQVQKYEKGTNRIGASRLQNIARVLQVPMGFFFEGAPVTNGKGHALDGAVPLYASEFAATSEGIRLTTAFTRIKEPTLRRRILSLVQEVAGQAD
jgi:transcriptional regulator with XRE-family HTH domain